MTKNANQILKELRAERDRIETVIAALRVSNPRKVRTYSHAQRGGQSTPGRSRASTNYARDAARSIQRERRTKKS